MERTQLISKFVPQVADFMADCYGRVLFDGTGTWTAEDGGAVFRIGSLSVAEATAIDYSARHLAKKDA